MNKIETKNPIVVRTLSELQNALLKRKRKKPLGFVPTMGALHAGHVALVERARSECGTVVASIYVNPTQFGPKEDLSNYPRDIEGDTAKLTEAGCDILFFPGDGLMYPPGESTRVSVLGSLTEGLCAKSRPGHFTGVATVVIKLLNLVKPDKLYLGAKDAQQVRVIGRSVADLFLPVEVIECPTVREFDGLAMSSRNAYLTTTERATAPILHASLCEARERILNGERDAGTVESFLKDSLLKGAGITIDYAVAVDSASLKPVRILSDEVLLAVAVKLGKARLIDNIVVRLPEGGK